MQEEHDNSDTNSKEPDTEIVKEETPVDSENKKESVENNQVELENNHETSVDESEQLEAAKPQEQLESEKSSEISDESGDSVSNDNNIKSNIAEENTKETTHEESHINAPEVQTEDEPGHEGHGHQHSLVSDNLEDIIEEELAQVKEIPARTPAQMIILTFAFIIGPFSFLLSAIQGYLIFNAGGSPSFYLPFYKTFNNVVKHIVPLGIYSLLAFTSIITFIYLLTAYLISRKY